MTKVELAHYSGTAHADPTKAFNSSWSRTLRVNAAHIATIQAAYEACGLKAMDSALEKMRNSGLYSMTTRRERSTIQTLHKIDAFRIRALHESVWGTNNNLTAGKAVMSFPTLELDDAPEFAERG